MEQIERILITQDYENNAPLNFVFQNLFEHPIVTVPGKVYYNNFFNVPFYWDSTDWIPFGVKAVHIKYSNQANLLADQARQLVGQIYHDINLDIYYEKLTTNTGSITADYNPIGGSGLISSVSNNLVRTIYINPLLLSGTGTLAFQVAEYINANLTIESTLNNSKINVILGTDPSIGFPYTLPLTLS